MPDMLVKRYDLPDERPLIEALHAQGLTIRKAPPPASTARRSVLGDWTIRPIRRIGPIRRRGREPWPPWLPLTGADGFGDTAPGRDA